MNVNTNNEDMSRITDRIFTRARDLHLRDADMARACGVSPQGVSTWKSRGTINKTHLDKLAVLLECEPIWLLLGRAEDAPGAKVKPQVDGKMVAGLVSLLIERVLAQGGDLSDAAMRARLTDVIEYVVDDVAAGGTAGNNLEKIVKLTLR